MFCRSTNFTTQFDGRPVKATLRPLSLEALLSVQGTPKDDLVEGTKRIAEAVRTHASLTEAPVDSDGKPVSLDEMCACAYFGSVVAEMGNALVKAAKPDPSLPALASVG